MAKVADSSLALGTDCFGNHVAANLPVTLRGADGTCFSGESRSIGLDGITVECIRGVPDRVSGLSVIIGKSAVNALVSESWRSENRRGQVCLLYLRFLEVEGDGASVLWRFSQERAREVAHFLRDSPGLPHLSLDDAFDLARSTQLRIVQADTCLYGPSTDDASLFLILRGRVFVTLGSKRRVLLEVAKPGQILGGIGPLLGQPAVECATASGVTHLLEFTRAALQQLESAKPTVFRLLSRAALSATIERLADATCRRKRGSSLAKAGTAGALSLSSHD